jgi:hypothetical protein
MASPPQRSGSSLEFPRDHFAWPKGAARRGSARRSTGHRSCFVRGCSRGGERSPSSWRLGVAAHSAAPCPPRRGNSSPASRHSLAIGLEALVDEAARAPGSAGRERYSASPPPDHEGPTDPAWSGGVPSAETSHVRGRHGAALVAPARRHRRGARESRNGCATRLLPSRFGSRAPTTRRGRVTLTALIDRVWARGVSRSRAPVDQWAAETRDRAARSSAGSGTTPRGSTSSEPATGASSVPS